MDERPPDRLNQLALQLQQWLERRGIDTKIGPGTLLLGVILLLTLVSSIAIVSWVQTSADPGSTESVTVSVWPPPVTVNPRQIISPLDSSSLTVANFLFEGLLRYDSQGSLQPGVASSIPVSEEGGLRYPFILREDAFWSDGAPVTADNFVLGAKRLLLSPSPFASIFKNLLGAEEFIEGNDINAPLAGIQASSPQILVIRLATPDRSFLHRLTLPAFFPEPPPPLPESQPIGLIRGNGPYTLETFDPLQMVLVKNSLYPDRGDRPGNLVFNFVEDPQTRFDLYRKDDLDITEVNILSGTLSEGLLDEYHVGIEDGTIALVFANNQPPFDQLLMRQSISVAMDRESLSERRLDSRARAALTWIPPASANYRREAGQINEHNASQAKSLFERATAESNPPVQPIRFQIEDTVLGREIGEFVSGQLKSTLSLTLELEPIPTQEYRNYMAAGDRITFSYRYQQALYRHPAAWLYDYFHSQGAFNQSGYSNPEMDSLLDQAITSQDILESQRLWKEAQDLLFQDIVIVPLVHPQRVAFIRPKIGDVQTGPMDWAFPGSMSIRNGFGQ